MAERAKHGNGRLQALRPVPLRSPAVQSARRRMSWLWSRESVLRLALSLVLATALWLYVTGKENPSYVDFGTPIAVSPTVPGNQNLIVTTPQQFVRVRYRPSNPNLFPTASSFQASVNLLNLGPGKHTVPVTVTSDPGFSVVGISPSKVTVAIEPLIQKKVNVLVRYPTGAKTPATGYYALSAQAVPNVVTVSGAQSLVTQVKDVVVTQRLTAAASTIITSSKPSPENSQGNLLPPSSALSVEPSTVTVTIPIRAVGGVKTLPVVVSIVGTPRVGFGVTSVTVDPPSVTAFGPPKTLNKVTTAPASVNVSGRKSGIIRRRIAIHLPRGVRANTSTATVTIRLAPIAASVSTDVAVQPVGVVTGLVAHIRPGAVLVTLVGPSSSVARAARGVTATVSVAGLAAGFYQLTPQITVPSGFKLQGSNPQTVGVSVQVAPSG